MTRYTHVGEHVPESDFDAMPANKAFSRDGMQPVTTDYHRISDDTEVVTWRREDGTGAQWTQTWVGGIDNAPPIGSLYRVLHDEWRLLPDGEHHRTIHAFQVCPEPEEGTEP